MTEKDSRRCLAVVTARGGSKAIPGKNLRELAGRPMVEYAIDVGLRCRYVTKVMVTTDSPEIRAAALHAGAEAPFLRPAELATDTARQEDAVLHAMDWYEEHGERFEILCLLQPTVPLRQPSTLERGFELLFANPRAAGVLSVAEANVSPLRCNTLRADGTLTDFVDNRYKWANRQEMPIYYEISPLVELVRWQDFKKEPTFCQDSTLSLVVDSIEGTDIDNPIDLVMTEWLLEHDLYTSEDLAHYVLSSH